MRVKHSNAHEDVANSKDVEVGGVVGVERIAAEEPRDHNQCKDEHPEV